MNIKLKQSTSVSELAKIFQIPIPLIKASNKDLKDSIVNENEMIYIPGFQSFKHEKTTDDTYESLSKAYEVTIEALKFVNDNLVSNNIVIPMRQTDLIVTDVNNYTYDKMNTHIDQLIKIYPFINKKIIGYSVLNKPIYELTIGNGPYHTHFNASFHGNEWITTAALLKSVNEYARLLTAEVNDQSLVNIFEKTTVSIAPMVNPDGVNLVINGLKSAVDYQDQVYMMNEHSEDFSRWKANINGIDLNKQFPANWSLEKNRKKKHPTYRDYPGKIPLSQPESIAMATFTKRNNFHRVHALHTQGKEIYWGFKNLEPMISEKIVNQYALVSNYKAVRQIDNYAGYKDWFIKTFRRPGFTIELGKGINPLPIEQFDKVYDETYNIFLTNLLLKL